MTHNSRCLIMTWCSQCITHWLSDKRSQEDEGGENKRNQKYFGKVLFAVAHIVTLETRHSLRESGLMLQKLKHRTVKKKEKKHTHIVDSVIRIDKASFTQREERKKNSNLQVKPVVVVQKQVLFCARSPRLSSFSSFYLGLSVHLRVSSHVLFCHRLYFLPFFVCLFSLKVQQPLWPQLESGAGASEKTVQASFQKQKKKKCIVVLISHFVYFTALKGHRL